MLKLNFALYNGATLLRDWWKQVMAHFTEVQNAHNALDERLGEESERLEGLISAEESARVSGDNVLSGRINTEKSERESADSALSQTISAKETELRQSIADAKSELGASITTVRSELGASISGTRTELSTRISDTKAELEESIADTKTELEGQISGIATDLDETVRSEAASRTSADSALSAQLNAEADSRQSADASLSDRISAVESKSHTHGNADVLESISGEDVTAWRSKTEFDTENRIMVEYLFGLLQGYSENFKAMYEELGVTLYDGGITYGDSDGEPLILDGGEFDEEDTASVDFGGFDDGVFALQVLDGGQY